MLGAKEQKSKRTKEQKDGKQKALLLFCSFALLFFLTEPTLAQGCALCRSAVASQVAKAIEAINTGIILLLIPPVGMMSAILFVAFRRRDDD